MSRRDRLIGPSLVRLARQVVGTVFRLSPREEVDEEFAFHVEMAVRRNIAKGMDPEEARREAERGFGEMERVKAECRRSGRRRMKKMGRREWFGDLWMDLRFAGRQLRNNPVFAAVAVVTLAVGIGANTAVFSVVNGVLLRPLPYEEPQDLIRLWARFLPESGYEDEAFPISPREAVEYRDATSVLGEIAYYSFGSYTFTRAGASPQELPVIQASADLFTMLGVPPGLGRWFSKDEDVPGGPAVAVLSHALWTSRFAADPNIIGQSMTLSGVSFEIVGVMPEAFGFPSPETRVYVPFQMNELDPGGWGWHGIHAIGRLAPGRSLEQADAELQSLILAWREEFGHPQVGHSIYLTPLREDVVRGVSSMLWLLRGAVVLVLLIASANVANLLLARGESRMREVSLRVALGAGRFRILRQLLTEGIVLAGAGALLGVGLAQLLVRGALIINPDVLPRTETIAMDLPVLGFTVAVALGSAILFGLAPALHAQVRPGAGLAAGTRAAGSSRGNRLRSALVVSEVALSLLVVVSAGLVTRSFVEIVRVDTGVDIEGRLTFTVGLPDARYVTSEEVRLGIRQIVDRMGAIPGVTSAAFSSSLPLTGARYLPDFRIEGRPRPESGERMLSAATHVVTPGYTETMGIGLVAGRRLDGGDRYGSGRVALIDEEALRLFWPGEDPLGRRIGFQFGSDTIPWATIVGIVENTRADGLQADIRPQIYLPHGQEQGFWGANERSGAVVLETAVDPLSLVPAVRSELAEADDELPLTNVRTMQDIMDNSVAQPRLTSGLLGSFGLMALLLAMVGVYGVVSYSVARRTKEIGVRIALGAETQRVVGLMVWEGARPALWGIALGLIVAWGAGSLLEGFLFGVSPTDPLTFVSLSLFLAAVALLASWIPSRRAAGVAPTEALREE